MNVTPGRLLREAMATRRGDNLIATIGAAGHQAGEALVPVMVGYALDQGVGDGDPVRLFWWLLAIAGAFALLSNSYLIHARAATRSSTAAAVRLRLRVADHLLDPAGVGDHPYGAGGLASVAARDVTAVGQINQVLFLLSAGVGGFAVAAISLFAIAPVLCLVAVAGAIPVVVGMQLLGVPLERRMVEERARAAEASDTAADLVRGLRVVKGLGAERAAGRRFRRVSRRALAATLRSARLGALFEATSVLATGVFVAVVAVIAGRMALSDEITVGALVAALGLAQFLVGPLMQLAATTALLAECRSAATRVASVLNRSAPRFEDLTPEGSPGRIEIALAAGTVTADAGEFTGVVADQRTAQLLAAALTGEPRPAADHVRLDGRPLPGHDVGWLRSAMLVLPHHSQLFSGTLGENVAAAADDETAVRQAVAAAAVDAVVDELPEGADSFVGEGGHMLSGGQRQRVALARALAARPPVLVLHEPTSAVDSVTEATIAARLRDLRVGSTTLVITTSPALLAACDRVVWVDGGVRTGRHEDLLGSSGYAEAVLR